ncbi:U2 small nuclear ribonucleoprotein B'', partial [Smittium mucronatum]
MDINLPNRTRCRGQAFVVFRDIESAAAAKRQLDGFAFYTKPLAINYAQNKSDAVAKLDGSYFADNVRSQRLKNRRLAASSEPAGPHTPPAL